MEAVLVGDILHAVLDGRDRSNYFCRVLALDPDGVRVQPQKVRSVADTSIEYPDFGWDFPDGDNPEEESAVLTPDLTDWDGRLRYRIWDGQNNGYRYL